MASLPRRYANTYCASLFHCYIRCYILSENENINNDVGQKKDQLTELRAREHKVTQQCLTCHACHDHICVVTHHLQRGCRLGINIYGGALYCVWKCVGQRNVLTRRPKTVQIFPRCSRVNCSCKRLHPTVSLTQHTPCAWRWHPYCR